MIVVMEYFSASASVYIIQTATKKNLRHMNQKDFWNN